MKCPICGKELEFKKKQVGIDELGEPAFHQYAICRDCKKQWNLDKQRAKKAAQTKRITEPLHTEDSLSPNTTSSDPLSDENSDFFKKVADFENDALKAEENEPQNQPPKPAKRKAPKKTDAGASQRYGNVPPEKVRTRSEKNVKRGYETMISTESNRKSKRRKPDASKSSAKADQASAKNSRRSNRRKRREKKPAFRVIRLLLGILSLAAFGYFTYCATMAGLNNISMGDTSFAGTAYLVLALCMLICGILLISMRNFRTVLAFLLPMLFSLLGAVFAFLHRGKEAMLLYGAAGGVILAVLLLFLAVFSKRHGSDSSSDHEDYES